MALGITGSKKLEGVNGYYSIDKEDDCNSLHTNLKTNPKGKLTIVGGGLSGLEAATEIAEFFPNLKITLVEANKIGKNYTEKAKEKIYNELKERKIQILENSRVQKFENGTLVLENGEKIHHDNCLLSVGFKASEIGKISGLEVNDKNQIKVNSFLQSEQFPEIFVAGDLAWVYDSKENYIRMACATAIAMGAYVAESLYSNFHSGKSRKPFSIGYRGTCLSLGREKGIIQITNADDSPKNLFFKGKMGARIKEFVSKSTISVMKLEKKFAFYKWPAGVNV